jgi:hypothetical protein
MDSGFRGREEISDLPLTPAADASSPLEEEQNPSQPLIPAHERNLTVRFPQQTTGHLLSFPGSKAGMTEPGDSRDTSGGELGVDR